ncbi:MAG: hypothetical protein ACYDBZ_15015 [Steroidobacteraceae bacterium]
MNPHCAKNATDGPTCMGLPVVILTPLATTVVTPGQTATVDVALGAIQGQVTGTLPSGCTPGVYLYSGNVTAPEDRNTTALPTDRNQALASVLLVATSTPPYYYQFGALPLGTYTLALTCQANQDELTQADAAAFSPVTTGIVVTADQITTVNIS